MKLDRLVKDMQLRHNARLASTLLKVAPNVPSVEAEPASKPAVKMGFQSKPKNVFAAAKKNALGGGKKAAIIEQPKKMSEAERIMKEELERKRNRGPSGFGGPAPKRQRF